MSSLILFYEDKINQTQQKSQEEISGKVKMNFFNLVNNPSISIPMEEGSTDNLPKKRGRPKKDITATKRLSDGSEIVLANEELPTYQSNTPYGESYSETNNMLKSAIIQADMMTGDIARDLTDIRLSKTLRKKYDYISLLSGTSSTLLSTKVSAIRELNKTITDCHNLELKRYKDLKLAENEQDDDKRMMDMYNAFISTPVGGGMGMSPMTGQFIPPSSDLTLGGIPNIIRANIDNSDAGYLNYVNHMSPEQNLMRYENNPNVKTVVVYDQSTGRRWFDVINIMTGESIPNVSRPDQMFLEDTTIDLRNKIARNTNLDTTYPLVVQGNAVAFEY